MTEVFISSRGTMADMPERWTRERRLSHTRSLLLDAAEQVFAEKGFTPATLDDIADTAGYTKGAIYAHFETKEDLFLEVCDRHWRRYFETFVDVLADTARVGQAELDEVARRWRELSVERGPGQAALGLEFLLYLARNPDVRDRVAAQRAAAVADLGSFVTEGIERLGGALSIPSTTFAQILIATSDSVALSSALDEIDLYRPVLAMYLSAFERPK
ncbi:TetR family transcriptional regulator [Skermania piniformis]